MTKLLAMAAAIPTTGLIATSVQAASDPSSVEGLRGSLDVSNFGVLPDTYDDQSQLLQRVLEKAAEEDRPVFLPPGAYVVSNISLPARTRLFGIAGTSRLIYGGGGAMLTSIGTELIEMSGITLDGANLNIADEYGGLLRSRACARVIIENCQFIGSHGSGISLDTCGGHIERSKISGAKGLAAIYAVNSTSLAVRNNVIEDCANGGILIHRWTDGEDSSIVSGNRIARIRADGGGTGQRGNGINLFRTKSVQVVNNHISDCAFSSIRANSASNAMIAGNSCMRSGETAIYAEFSFQGSLISNNIVDGGTIGISIANFNEGGRLAVCSNNLIRNIKTTGPYPEEFAGFGIGIYAEAETNITGNVIEGAPKYGLCLGWGPYLRNVLASNNIIRDVGEGIAVSVAKGAGVTSISGNIISDFTKGAIIGHKWQQAVTKDLTGRSAPKFKHLTIAGNQVMQSSTG